ncbi:MAG: DUF4071 domain-containing protein [Desulfobacteraceae bacterium]|nr:DUF4071 domain-containing protein [Desulfobacteraceae bacterium]
MDKPLCFVLMPFGEKPYGGGTVDFDAVYKDIIAPAIAKAGLHPLRADEEMTGGIIHKPMFERLILCEYAIADLTTANANVFYELGVRHAVRPWSTVLIFAEGGRLPFDVSSLRAMPYALSPGGKPANVDEAGGKLVALLKEARNASVDSPIFQLVEGFPELDHTKTDVFRDRVKYSAQIKEKLEHARREGLESIREVHRGLGKIEDCEAGVVMDLFLSYRAVKAWEDMIGLVPVMSLPLAATVMVQEQLALALNRAGKGEAAEKVLVDLLSKRGPSSETYGILGRIYKDRWEEAFGKGDNFTASGLLDKAIDTYLKGFEADWRDAYPGINAVTLMEIREPKDHRIEQILPVVVYSVERRIAAGAPDYWDYATLLELAVIAKNQKNAFGFLCKALASVREPWEPETTARNLRLIRQIRDKRAEALPWAKQIEDELERKQSALRVRE